MRRGVTLLELLICVGIIAVLIGLLLSAVQMARAEAVRLKSQNKLRQIVLATHSYASAHQGRLPGYGWHVANDYSDGAFDKLLPFVEADRTSVPNPYHRSNWEYILAYV